MMPMEKHKLILILAVLLIAIFAVSAPAAVMYKYVDDKGNVVVTDDKDSIPPKYQHNAEVVKDDDSRAKFTPESKASSLLKHIRSVWYNPRYKKVWPALEAVIWIIITLMAGRFIISQSRRRLMLFFSALTALTYVLVMYTMVLK